MRKTVVAMGAFATLVLANASPAMADLIGTSVTGYLDGSLTGAGPNDFVTAFVSFDPVTATISASEIEFNRTSIVFEGTISETADFTANGLAIVISLPADFVDFADPQRFRFTDTAFIGATVTQVSNTFDVGTILSLSGDVLSVTLEAGASSGEADFSITTPASVPAPIVGAGLPGLVFGFCGLIGWKRRRRQTGALAA